MRKLILLLIISLMNISNTTANEFSTGFYFGSSSGEFENTSSNEAEHYGVLGFKQTSRDSRWGVGFESVDNTSFQPNAGGIGVTASRTLFYMNFEKRLVIGEIVKPYFGTGIIYSQNKFTNRFKVDDEKFFSESISDESSSDISAQFLISQEFNVWENILMGLRGRYELSTEDFSGLSLSAYGLFKF